MSAQLQYSVVHLMYSEMLYAGQEYKLLQCIIKHVLRYND